MSALWTNTWLQAFGVIAATSAVLTAQNWQDLKADFASWRRGPAAPAAASPAPAIVPAPNSAAPAASNVPIPSSSSGASDVAAVPRRTAPTPAPPVSAPAKSAERFPDAKRSPVPASAEIPSNGGAEEFQQGMKFYEGIGVAKDFSRAIDAFQKAAAAGNAQSMAKLGWMFWFGEGVEPDAAQGAVWFRRGAAAGNAEAQYWLAVFYEKGYGNVKKDGPASLDWMRKSAAQGFPKAVAALQAKGENP